MTHVTNIFVRPIGSDLPWRRFGRQITTRNAESIETVRAVYMDCHLIALKRDSKVYDTEFLLYTREVQEAPQP